MEKKNVIAIIPARGGSKGIKNKNLRNLAGKPLIKHSIDYAKQSKLIDKIIVSTDSENIKNFALSEDVFVFERPNDISGDKALVIDAIRHVLSELEEKEKYRVDIIVLLECTSPIKSVDEIEQAINILIDEKADSVASFKETAISPNRFWKIENDLVVPFINGANPFLPRQMQPVGYELSGQVYALTARILNLSPNSISILLGKVHPIITKTVVIDIDNEIDLLIAEKIFEYNKM
jgi:CMP-N,N'-diacetyllegionaminic acid synthase